MQKEHNKKVFRDTPWGDVFFMDHYRYAGANENSPLIYYIGGGVDANTIKRRLHTEPQSITTEFEAALQSRQRQDIHLLISPPPLTFAERRDSRLTDFISFFLAEIIPATVTRLPNGIGLLGNSYGGFFATYLAFTLRAVRTVATIGGVVMVDAISKLDIQPGHLPQMKCYSNSDDEARSFTEEFEGVMEANQTPIEVVRRAGGHAYDYYKGNGSVKEAFEFLLDS